MAVQNVHTAYTLRLYRFSLSFPICTLIVYLLPCMLKESIICHKVQEQFSNLKSHSISERWLLTSFIDNVMCLNFYFNFKKNCQHVFVKNCYFGYGNSSSGTRVHPRGETDLSEVIGRMYIWFTYQLHNEHGVLQLDDGRWYACFLQKWNLLQENGPSCRVRKPLLWSESSSRKWYVCRLINWLIWLIA